MLRPARAWLQAGGPQVLISTPLRCAEEGVSGSSVFLAGLHAWGGARPLGPTPTWVLDPTPLLPPDKSHQE